MLSPLPPTLHRKASFGIKEECHWPLKRSQTGGCPGRRHEGEAYVNLEDYASNSYLLTLTSPDPHLGPMGCPSQCSAGLSYPREGRRKMHHSHDTGQGHKADRQPHFISRVQACWAGSHARTGGAFGPRSRLGMHAPRLSRAPPSTAQSSGGLRAGGPAAAAAARSGYTRKPEKVMYLPWLL